MRINTIRNNSNIHTKYYTRPVFKAKAIDRLSRITSPESGILVMNALNEKIQPFYDKFHLRFHNDYQIGILDAFAAALNPDKSLNEYALKAIYALYDNKFINKFDNIKFNFSKRQIKQKDKEHNKHNCEELLNVANIVNSCRDNDEIHNRENIKFAEDLYLFSRHNSKDIPKIINAIKDESGVCTKKEIVFYKYLDENYPQSFMRLINVMPDKDGKVSDSVKNFIKQIDGSTQVNSFGFERYNYIVDVLTHTNTPNRDEILDFISKSEFLRKYCPSINCYTDETKNINLDYIKKYLEIVKTNKYFEIPARIYQSEDKDLTDKNIALISTFSKEDAEHFADSIYFKKDGVINKEFTDFIKANDYMFRNQDSYNAYPFVDTSITLAKDKDGNIRWDIAEMLLNFGYKFSSQGKVSTGRVQIMLEKAAELCKDESGEFNVQNSLKVKGDLDFFISHHYGYCDEWFNEAEDILNGKYIHKNISGKNLYDAEVMLEVLDKLNADFRILTTSIPEYENLLFAIADIPPENNPKAYQKIISRLYKLSPANYNIKDSHGISFLEKVLNSENSNLLSIITNPTNIKLEYSPELDFAYNGIQNKTFKKQVDNELKLRFPLLEKAARTCSIGALSLIREQLDSPLCHKKEVFAELWRIAIGKGDKTFCDYLAAKYPNELPENALIDLVRFR